MRKTRLWESWTTCHNVCSYLVAKARVTQCLRFLHSELRPCACLDGGCPVADITGAEQTAERGPVTPGAVSAGEGNISHSPFLALKQTPVYVGFSKQK